jgi:hypothetical protein
MFLAIRSLAKRARLNHDARERHRRHLDWNGR